MLDAKVTPFIKPLLKPLIKALDSKAVTPNQVTLAGFVIGVLALPFIILNWWWGNVDPTIIAEFQTPNFYCRIR